MVRKTPRKERAPGDYAAVGQKGRRTGVTLEDTGVRDEHGMEPIPAFSSPQKLPTAGDGYQQETNYTGTYMADDSMEMAQSTIIEPLEMVRSAKNARDRRSIPRSVSPRKGLINGSPRRSVGLLSSPSKNVNNGSPSRSLLQQPPNRQLDFSMGPPLSNGGISPHRTLLKPNASASSSRKGKNKRPFDLSGLDDEDNEGTNDENASPTTNGMTYDDEPLPDGDDEPLGDIDFDQGIGGDQTLESIEQDYSNVEGESNALADPEPLNEGGEETVTVATPKSRKRGRPSKKAPVAQMVQPDVSELSISAPASGRRGPAKGTGGRPKKARTQVYEDPDVGSAAQTSRRRPNGRAPKERDPNVRPKPTARATPKAPSSRAGSVGPRNGGTYLVQRSETPMTDSGAIVTRSGRASYKPLAAWRGEKAVFGMRPDRETPAPLTDIIRTDEITMPPPPRRKPSRKARARSELEEIEEEPQDVEPWETETGIMHAQVMQWDQEMGKYDENDVEEAEVAYAAEAIEMRDIAGADFKFAKTLTLPFFGSGMVQLPPRGVKKIKNSRKMQMVFFVHQGRVTVNVGTPTTGFSIGKGGQWQVPRGNFYSISNDSDTRDARIFFAQGCEWAGEFAEESVNA